MMYSANYFGGKHYAVGYATASAPLGPYKKAPNNPVLQKNTAKGGIVTGTGHNSIAYSPDARKCSVCIMAVQKPPAMKELCLLTA
jgi:beta-xylosidase